MQDDAGRVDDPLNGRAFETGERFENGDDNLIEGRSLPAGGKSSTFLAETLADETGNEFMRVMPGEVFDTLVREYTVDTG
jgi:hypothetical protein